MRGSGLALSEKHHTVAPVSSQPRLSRPLAPATAMGVVRASLLRWAMGVSPWICGDGVGGTTGRGCGPWMPGPSRQSAVGLGSEASGASGAIVAAAAPRRPPILTTVLLCAGALVTGGAGSVAGRVLPIRATWVARKCRTWLCISSRSPWPAPAQL